MYKVELSIAREMTLIEVVWGFRPSLVVVDTLARCMLGGEENSARDMGLFVAACDRIRMATGATVLVVHHTGKSAHVERGSSALRAACDQMIRLTGEGDYLTVACDKSKEATLFPPRTLRLLTVETGRIRADGEPETSCVVVPAGDARARAVPRDAASPARGGLGASARRVLEVLCREPYRDTGIAPGALSGQADLKPATLYKVLHQLSAAGYIRQARRGAPYLPTRQGQAILGAM
jgi:hypothetical protein